VSSHLCLFFTELSQHRQKIGVGEEVSSPTGNDCRKCLPCSILFS
jgi:hypothetical protein